MGKKKTKILKNFSARHFGKAQKHETEIVRIIFFQVSLDKACFPRITHLPMLLCMFKRQREHPTSDVLLKSVAIHIKSCRINPRTEKLPSS